MIKFNEVTGENKHKYNLAWSQIPGHPYRILIFGGSGSGKTNALLNLTHHQENNPFIDKILLYVKDLCEPKTKMSASHKKG